MNNTANIFLVVIIALLLVGVGLLYWNNTQTTSEYEVPLSNNEANVEPGNNDMEWQVASTTEYSISYPADSGLEYVELADWPPQVSFENESFSCAEGGDEENAGGRTETVSVGGNDYCRTVSSEGAAGSVYQSYQYSYSVGDETVAYINFGVRYPQCQNYEGDEADECEDEQMDFDPDEFIDEVVSTIVVAETT